VSHFWPDVRPPYRQRFVQFHIDVDILYIFEYDSPC